MGAEKHFARGVPKRKADDIDGLDLVDTHPAEVEQYLALDHVLLRMPRVLAKPRHHVLGVDLVEGLHRRVHRFPGLCEEVALPGSRLILTGKAPLSLVPSLAVVVVVPGLRRPRPV